MTAWDAAAEAMSNLFGCPCVGGIFPSALVFLVVGVLVGLVIGLLPGLGGISGLALLIPLTYGMEPVSAIATLMGLLSVTTISDTIPAVLFAVPGSAGSQATVLDGFPMAQKGEAGRALGAAYTANLLGGIFGGLVLAAALPAMRSLLYLVGSPELFMLGLLGISMVGVLSGGAPIKGLIAAGIGLLLGAVGLDPFRALPRWDFGTHYLRDGIGVVPLSLGLFAVPEVMDLAIRGTQIAQRLDSRSKGVMDGIRDSFRHWFLVLRSSVLGAFLGAVPGIGITVIDWFAYGHAVQTEKGTSDTFGKGDVRGVIAPEAANNAKEGGSLIPTLAFAIPGSASMALMLAAFIMHGVHPGLELLTDELGTTYTIVGSLMLATIMGAAIVLILSRPLGKLALVPIHFLVPGILALILLASFQDSRRMGDIYVLLVVSALGWFMKRLSWPRPPLLLGFVLAGILERYMAISLNLYGATWLRRPIVIIIGLLIAGLLAQGIRRDIQQRRHARRNRNLDRNEASKV